MWSSWYWMNISIGLQVKMFLRTFYIVIVISMVSGNVILNDDKEDEKLSVIRNIIDSSDDRKGWINFLALGNWSDSFFKKMQGIPTTFSVSNGPYMEYTIEEEMQYPAKTLVMDSENFADFESKINIVRDMPYWHPHTNIVLYYHNFTESNEIIARIFFALWYYRVPNAIILQYNDASEVWTITSFNPYTYDKYKLEYSFGCWTRKKLAYSVTDFHSDMVCTEECHNVTLNTIYRIQHLGTCIGFDKITIPYNDSTQIQKYKLFEDKGKNMHGFPLRSYLTEVEPFFLIDDNEDGTYRIHGRDGLMWTTMSAAMNFTIDLSPSVKTMKDTFDFELSIQQIYDLARRIGDLMLLPIYKFDLVIVDVDMSVAFKDSGICFLSHRAGFETALIDINLFQSNYTMLVKFLFCFVGIWFVFFVYNKMEKDVVSRGDQAGKDLVNAIRNILSISLYKPPKKASFKIFLLITIWSFFIINFATQAAIISFFSVFKRGKDVDTYEDVSEKGYLIEGLATPDVMLPDTEEKFRKINAKLVPIRHLFSCVTKLSNNSHLFCLIDCSVGRYLVRNWLNEKGEQYLHIAKDQIHSNYLNMLFPKYSVMTDEFNNYMLLFLQAGLINKWEQYRFANIKYEAPVKSLDMNDLIGIFKCYGLLVGMSAVIFFMEVCSIGANKIVKYFSKRNY